MLRAIISTLLLLSHGTGLPLHALSPQAPPPFPEPPTKILLLGTFHFKDAGLDAYKPEFDVDIRSPERQRQVVELVEALVRFEPTKIAVEARAEAKTRLDERYTDYLAGEFELPSNEIYQLGFRLAKRLQHDRVWPVDAPGRRYEPFVDPGQWAKEHGQQDRLDPLWQLRYQSLYRWSDEQKTRETLSETLLRMNEEKALLRMHGHYLIGSFEVGAIEGPEDERYPGVDAQTAWYNRNLRIFANLQRLVETSEERILLVIGAGHVPILRHAIQASPQFELIELDDVL